MMSKSSLSISLRADKKAYRDKVIKRLCDEIKYAAQSSINGKIPYGFIKKLLNETKEEEPWINRNLISFVYRKYVRRLEEDAISEKT